MNVARLFRYLPGNLGLTRGRGRRTVYLTFDDGPNPEHTPRLVRMLNELGVAVTFFVIGRELNQHGDVAEFLVRSGHRLGNHSYSHGQFITAPLHEQLAEIRRTDQAIGGFQEGRVDFRPPRGMIRRDLAMSLLRSRRRVVLWSLDSEDYRLEPADIQRRFRERPLRPGEIVLFHDDSDRCLVFLEQQLPRWLADGWQFSALV